jgi:hypothetical protein
VRAPPAPLPAHNLEAEESVLGAMLLSPEAAIKGVELVNVADFYKPLHARIFEAIARLSLRDVPADPVIVADELKNMGQPLEDPGVLISIMTRTPSTKNIEHHAAIVAEKALRRQRQHAAQEYLVAVSAGDDEKAEYWRAIVADGSAASASTGGLSPIDVGEVMRKDEPRVEPDLLRCVDGKCLLIRGTVTALNGEPSTGKTFLACEAMRQVLVDGGSVVMIDYEGSERMLAERLLELGVDPSIVSERLTYLRPGDIPPATVARFTARAEPDLVVIDSLAAGLADHRPPLDEDKTPQVLPFLRRLARALAKAGAAVIIIDHVAKSKADRGRWGRGSGSKLGEYDVAYGLELVQPFSRGHDGCSALKIQKDRTGAIGPERSIAATVDFTTNIAGRLQIELKSAVIQVAEWNGPTDCMKAVRELLESSGVELSINKMDDVLRFAKTTIADAANRLAVSDSEPISVRLGPRNAQLYRFDRSQEMTPK